MNVTKWCSFISFIIAVMSFPLEVDAVRRVGSDALGSSPFVGLRSEEILSSISSQLRPSSYPDACDRDAAVISWSFVSADGCLDGITGNIVTVPDALIPLRVVPDVWVAAAGETDRSSISSDLHNIVATVHEVEMLRSDYPPGNVTVSLPAASGWFCGEGEIGGIATSFYSPADDFKGDIARIYMYIAAVYPQSLWTGRAPMVYLDGHYPRLTVYGRSILLEWHRSDPVSDFELRRNDIIKSIQGYGNPFVEYPQLAEYVWGDHAGEVFPDDSSGGDDDPVSAVPILKSTYSRTYDTVIGLRSPYVPSDARWSIDGWQLDAPTLSTDAVEEGCHTLSFTCGSLSGRVIITVEP